MPAADRGFARCGSSVSSEHDLRPRLRRRAPATRRTFPPVSSRRRIARVRRRPQRGAPRGDAGTGGDRVPIGRASILLRIGAASPPRCPRVLRRQRVHDGRVPRPVRALARESRLRCVDRPHRRAARARGLREGGSCARRRAPHLPRRAVSDGSAGMGAARRDARDRRRRRAPAPLRDESQHARHQLALDAARGRDGRARRRGARHGSRTGEARRARQGRVRRGRRGTRLR